eukprot:TRINITY_DN582_c0_g1_i1.p1 TRINITY_DN582_c0_g1~~TRINITY_DN582_c0_g1_i1.p1  ORF type:complete len:2231 (-),score=746.77 TRINITY_DN582_c0_g1_i1:105-6797(-)
MLRGEMRSILVLVLLSVAVAVLASPNDFTGIGFLDEIQGIQSKEGSVYLPSLDTDLLIADDSFIENGVTADGGSESHVVDTRGLVHFSAASMSIAAASDLSVSSTNANVRLAGEQATLGTVGEFSGRTSETLVASQQDAVVRAIGGDVSLEGDSFSAQAMSDIHIRSRGDAELTASDRVVMRGSTGSFSTNSGSEVEVSNGNFDLTAGESLFLNNGGDMSLVAENGVQVHSDHNYVRITSFAGVAEFKGTNVDIDGQDGITMDTLTEMVFEAGTDFRVHSDEAAFSAASIEWSTEEGDFSFSSSGNLRAVGADIALIGTDLAINAVQDAVIGSKDDTSISIDAGVAVGGPETYSVGFKSTVELNLEGQDGVNVESSIGDIVFSTTNKASPSELDISAFDGVFRAGGRLLGDVEFLTTVKTFDDWTFNATDAVELLSANDAAWTIEDTFSILNFETNFVGHRSLSFVTTRRTNITTVDLDVLTESALTFSSPDLDVDLELLDVEATRVFKQHVTGELDYSVSGYLSMEAGFETFFLSDGLLFFATGEDYSWESQSDAEFIASNVEISTGTLGPGGFYVQALAPANPAELPENRIVLDATNDVLTFNITGGEGVIDMSEFIRIDAEEDLTYEADDEVAFEAVTLALVAARQQGSIVVETEDVDILTNGNVFGSGGVRYEALTGDMFIDVDELDMDASNDAGDSITITSAAGTDYKVSGDYTVQGGDIFVDTGSELLVRMEQDITIRDLNSDTMDFASDRHRITSSTGDLIHTAPITELSTGDNMLINVDSGDVNIYSKDEQPIEFFSNANIELEGDRGYQWSAPLGSMYIQVDGDGTWEATDGTMTFKSSGRSSYFADDDLYVTTTYDSPTGIYMESRQVNFYAKETMEIETTDVFDIESSSTEDTITSGTLSTGYAADIDYNLIAGGDVIIEVPTFLYFETLEMDVVINAAINGTLLEGGQVDVSAENLLSLVSGKDVVLQTSPPEIGNENDHDVSILTRSTARGVAQDNWQLVSNGVNEQTNLAVDIFVEDGDLLVKHGNLGVNVVGDDIQFVVDGTSSFRAHEKITINAPEGGFDWEAQSGYTGESYSVLLETTNNGPSTDAANIAIVADQAEVLLAGSSGLSYEAFEGSAVFTGFRGMEVFGTDGDVAFESTFYNLEVFMKTSLHIASGTNTDEGTSAGSIEAGDDFSLTADDRIRLHSLSRIAGATKLGLDISAGEDLHFTASGRNKRIEIQPDGSAFFNGQSFMVNASQEIQLKAENGAVLMDLNAPGGNGAGGAIYNVGWVEMAAGGLDGYVELSARDTFTIASDGSALTLGALGVVSVSASGEDGISMDSGTGGTFVGSDSRTGGIFVDGDFALFTSSTIDMVGHQIDLSSEEATISVFAFESFQIGVSNTQFEPRVVFMSESTDVDSRGSIKISTELESIGMEVETAEIYANRMARLRTEKTAFVGGQQLEVTSADAITFKGEIATEFAGDQTYFQANDIRVLAVTNVANNGISFTSSNAISFESVTDELRFSTTGLSTFDSSGYVQFTSASDTDMFARRNLKLWADSELGLLGESATTLRTENRNGAKMEFTTNAEDADIFVVPDTSILVDSVTGVELRGGGADIEAEVNLYVNAEQDMEVEGSGYVGYFADNELTIHARDDILFETTDEDSEIEFFGFRGFRATADEDLRFETEVLQRGDVLFIADGNLVAEVGSFMEIESDRDFRMRTAFDGDMLVRSEETTSVNVDGYIDVFVGEEATVSGEVGVNLRSELGQVAGSAGNDLSFLATSVFIDADDGFVSVTHGGRMEDALVIDGAEMSLNTTGTDADMVFVGRSVIFTVGEGDVTSFGSQQYVTTQRGGDIIHRAHDVVTYFGDTVSVTATTEAHDQGWVSMWSEGVLQMQAQVEVLISTEDGATSITSTTGGIIMQAIEDEFSVHATGTVELEARLAGTTDPFNPVSDYSILIESIDSSIAFRTSDAGTGHITVAATHGVLDVDAESVLVFNTEEGVDVRARNAVRLVGNRQLGLAGIIFDIEDSIHLQTLSDDITLRGDEVLMNVLSTGNLLLVSDGSEAEDTLSVRARSGVNANTGSTLITTLDAGNVVVEAQCLDPDGVMLGSCGMQVTAGDRVQVEAETSVRFSAQEIDVTAGDGEIRFEASRGRIVLDSNIGVTQIVGEEPIGHGVYLGGENSDGFVLLPYRGIVQDGSGCPVEREFALADEFDGSPGLCYCERGVWSCSYIV